MVFGKMVHVGIVWDASEAKVWEIKPLAGNILLFRCTNCLRSAHLTSNAASDCTLQIMHDSF